MAIALAAMAWTPRPGLIAGRLKVRPFAVANLAQISGVQDGALRGMATGTRHSMSYTTGSAACPPAAHNLARGRGLAANDPIVLLMTRSLSPS